MIRQNPLSILLVIVILSIATGQQPQQRPTAEPPKPPAMQPQNPPEIDSQDVVKITSNLVQIDAVVTKDGKHVTDLRPEDFEILEDGKPQAITNFSYISNLPATPAAVVSTATAKSTDKTAIPIPPAKINLSDQRRIVALVIDDLGISWESMSQVRAQVKKFIDQALPNDLIAIVRTSGDVGSLQQFTNDKRVLQSAWEHLRWNPCSRAGIHVFEQVGAVRSPQGQTVNAGLCSMFTTNTTLKSLNFIVKGMRNLPGRKSLVLFSDSVPIQNQESPDFDEPSQSIAGPPSGSGAPGLPTSGTSYEAQLNLIAEVAIRGSVVIYGVDTRGLQITGLTAADDVASLTRQGARQNSVTNSIMSARAAQLWNGRAGQELISKQTGGFMIRNSNDFGLKEIMNDQQGYYLIGFRPAEETFNRNFHHIGVRLKPKGLTVRTRAGFYGFTDQEARPKEFTAADEIDQALISPFGARDINLRLTSFFIDDPSQGPMIRSFLYLDPHDLNISEIDGWHVAHLEIKGLVFGDNGKIIAHRDRSGNFRYPDDAFQRAIRDGMLYTLDVPVKANGGLQFRISVRDQNTSKIGTAGQFVEVPNLHSGSLALSGIVASVADDKPQTLLEAGLDTASAVRQFRQGSTVRFAYAIYNASAAGHQAQLTSQMRLVRDGKVVFTGNATPVTVTGQSDLQRLMEVATLSLGPDLTPGDYVCQIIVTDSSERDKPRVATQWIDFEVVK